MALLTGRLIAAVAFSSAFVAVLVSLNDRLRDLLTVRRSAHAHVAIGLDADSVDFLASIAQENSHGRLKNGGPLVVLTIVPDRPEVERLRMEGALVLKIDIDNPSVIHDLFRSTAIETLYLLSSDATSNIRRFNELVRRVGTSDPTRSVLSNAWARFISFVYLADDWLAGNPRTTKTRGTRDMSFTISDAVVRIDNVWDAEEWRAEEIERGPVDVSAIGLYESTAQAIIRPLRHPDRDVLGLKFDKPDPVTQDKPDPVTQKAVAIWADAQVGRSETPETASRSQESTRNFVVCGSSQLTLGLLSALSRSAYEEDQLRAALHAYEENRLRAALKKAEDELDSIVGEDDSAHVRTEVEEHRQKLHEHCASPARSPGRVIVHLIAPDASAIRASFYERATRRRRLMASDGDSHPLRIDVTDSDPHVDTVQRALQSIDTTATSRAVVIITDNATKQSGLLGTMVAGLPESPKAVFEHSADVGSQITNNPTGHLQYRINLDAPMGDPRAASRAIETLNDARAIAELCHSDYLLRWVNVTFAAEKHEHRREAENFWEELDRFYKLDNERPILHMRANLRRIRENLIEAKSGPI